ncbi:NifU family protein [candidate division GN15 bacterium]|nr:NifU family protein [candidate division GN15 bacterium]
MTEDTQQIQITGEPQMDPNVCKFTVDRPVYPEGSVRCTSAEMAEGSPLLEGLFAVEGIKQVFVYNDTIVIAKDNEEAWPALGQKIGPAIRAAIASGEKLISDDVKRRLPSEQELRGKLEELVNSEINPAVAQHGGHVEVVDVRGNAAYITFSGGCQGCAASSVTLKQGIEKIVFSQLPEITEVVDVTDHAAGVNPYY